MNNFTREQLLEVFNHLTRDEVKSILENNGINSEYLEDTKVVAIKFPSIPTDKYLI